MKQIHYRIFRGEKSNLVKITIPEDLFKFLSQYITFVEKNHLVSPSTLKNIELIGDKKINLQFEIIYDVLGNATGILPKEIEDLEIEDYQKDKIIVHVYLDVE